MFLERSLMPQKAGDVIEAIIDRIALLIEYIALIDRLHVAFVTPWDLLVLVGPN